MSIASEITRINNNIAAAYTALDGKGATMPETQNSANLADTVNTITTGGGGGSGEDFDENAFNSAVSAMNSIMAIQSSSDTESARFQRLIDAGFVYNYGANGQPSRQYCFILQLSQETKLFSIRVDAPSHLLFKVANDVNVYTSDGYNKTSINTHTRSNELVATFDFTNSDDRTILLGLPTKNNRDPLQALGYAVALSSDIKVGRDIRAIHMYLTLNDKYGSAGNISTQGFSSTYCCWQYTRILTCEPFVSGCTKASTLSSTIILSYNNNLKDTSFLAQTFATTFFDSELGVFKAPPISDITSGYTPASIFQYDCCTNKDGKIPFIVDLGAGSSSGTISCGLYTSLYPASITLPPRTAYIKLPSNRSVDLRIVDPIKGSTAYTSPYLSLASWQYLADNAPTVSGLTLQIGKEAYTELSDGASSILTTLTSKGWTVS